MQLFELTIQQEIHRKFTENQISFTEISFPEFLKVLQRHLNVLNFYPITEH